MSALFNSSAQSSKFLQMGRSRYSLLDESTSRISPGILSSTTISNENWDQTHDLSSSSALSGNMPIDQIPEHSGLSSNEKSKSRTKSFTQSIDLLDSSGGADISGSYYSSFEGVRQRGYSEDASRIAGATNVVSGGQYDLFDDDDERVSYEFDQNEHYRRVRSLSRGLNNHHDSSYNDVNTKSYGYPSIHNEQICDDLFRWIWGVIYKNDGLISLNSLADLLYSASNEWFEVIENRFYGLHTFLTQYPLEYYVFHENGSIFVSLMPQQTSRPQRSRSRSNGRNSQYDASEIYSEPLHGQASSRGESRTQSVRSITHDDVIPNVISFVSDLLRTASNYTLKAVELANSVRDTFGTMLLSRIREEFMGLLNLLECYPTLFSVTRIPKSDFVTLLREGRSLSPVIEGPRGRGQGRCAVSEGSSRQSTPQPRTEAIKVSRNNGSGSRCLHVGNVGIRASDDDLRHEFGQFGQIEDVKIVHQGERRYAFVYFMSTDDAEQARVTLTRQPKWKGNISFAKKEKEASERKIKNTLPSRHLWLGNVNTRTVSVADLRALFEPYGTIENINLLYDKNCVFIDFFEESSAVAALHRMKGIVLGGNIIELGFGKYDEKPTSIHTIVLTEDHINTILSVFSSIMNTLRPRDYLLLSDILNHVLSSSSIISTSSNGTVNTEIEIDIEEKDLSPQLILNRNLDFLRNVLNSVSNQYVILEDTISKQVFYRNHSFFGKLTIDQETYISLLKDILLSKLHLVIWPINQKRDMCIINLTRQLLSRNGGEISMEFIANSVCSDLFLTNKSINFETLSSFFCAYNAIFTLKDGIVGIKKV